VDEASGGSRHRPAYRQLFADAHRRRFDLLLFWALDRFSREGALETLQALQRLTSYGVGWKSLTEEYLDSAGVFKDAIVSIMATLARQERVKISERTKAGLARARAQGKQLGRPKKIFDRHKAIEMRRIGASVGAIAEAVGISRSLAFRLTRANGPARGSRRRRVRHP
jgi:DNA invertase Pin-like site-specific DNA recombinase